MIPTDCPYGDDPRMCEYCSLKDTCDHKCCPQTTVAWGNITGLLTDQTDLVAELDKRQTEVKTEITESTATLQTAIDNVDGKVETNTANIATNTTNIADLSNKHDALQSTLESDYYKKDAVDEELSDLFDTLSQDITTAQSSAADAVTRADAATLAAGTAQSEAAIAQSSADSALSTATAAQSSVDTLKTTVTDHTETLETLPYRYPYFERTVFTLKKEEAGLLIHLPIALEKELILTISYYLTIMPDDNDKFGRMNRFLNAYIIPIYKDGEILNLDKTKHHIQHFQAWHVHCFDIVRSVDISNATIISEPCLEIEFGEDIKALYAEALGLPIVAMRITEDSLESGVWFFVDSKSNIVAKKGFQA